MKVVTSIDGGVMGVSEGKGIREERRGGWGAAEIRIQTRYALSPRLFSEATEIISIVFKSVPPVDVEILSHCLWNHKKKHHKNSCKIVIKPLK